MLNYKTDCRKKLFQWLDEYKIITVRMCRDMFYNSTYISPKTYFL